MKDNRLVRDYLDRLDAELAGVPRARRRELVSEISEHLEALLADHPQPSDADVLNALDRLGDPAEIAREERERLGLRPARAGAREVIALVLLPIGGVVLPLVGWLVGVVLLWLSDAWTARDKILGTLILPGGLALPLLLGTIAVSGEGCGSELDPATGAEIPGSTVCTGGPSHAMEVLGPILLAAAILAPLAMVVYLAVRLRHSAATV